MKNVIRLFFILGLFSWNLENSISFAAFSIIQTFSVASSGSSCTTNGSDGQAAAPASTAPQFSTLLGSYGANIPNWCIAGVGYAVGYTPNATVSGSTITETGNANIPANNDKKSFYPQSGGSLPGGITQGTAYFLCNVTNTTGSTYTYTLSTTTACGSPVTLSGSAPSFIALKVPGSTTNTPSGTSGWSGTDCGFGATFYVCVTSNNVTLDHWDFSQGGGWGVFPSSVSGLTVTNNYFLAGTNARGVLQDEGNAPSGVTFSNNIVDGNAVVVNTTAAGAGSGTSLAVTSASGLRIGMTICDLTHTSATSCPGSGASTYIIGIAGTTLTLSASTTVSNGDSLAFLGYPNPDNSEGGSPQISFSPQGSLTAQYNWIRNTCSEHWQAGFVASLANTSFTFKYNVLENTGWCGPVNGEHGDGVQFYGTSGSSFGAIVLSYNTVIQNNANAQASSGNFTMLSSGTFGATSPSGTVSNNVGVYPLGSGTTLTSNYGLVVNNPSWFTTSITFTNNYEDPTSACPGTPSGCGASAWALASSTTGGTGTQTPTCTATGNVNLKTGAALPKPAGGYC